MTFSAFQDTINDLIEFVYDPANLVYGGENENIDRARIRGIEAGWELRTDPWSVQRGRRACRIRATCRR